MKAMLIRAAFFAAAALASTSPSTSAAQNLTRKALVYCPVPIDAVGCNTIAAALSTTYLGGVDKAYDGQNGTIDLATADLGVYEVFIVPSLADDSAEQPYAKLRDPAIAHRLRDVLIGRRAFYSGTPDQGGANRAEKDGLINNLANWASANYGTVNGPGLVVFIDQSENESTRYNWVVALTGIALAGDPASASYSAVRSLTSAGSSILTFAGASMAYANMATDGFILPQGAAGVSLDAVGQTGTPQGGQIVLVTSSGGNTGTAIVMTDKDDYAPGETVKISGFGWQPGETITITLHEDPLLHTNPPPLTATADASGSFVNTQFSPDQHDVGIRFVLTASGSSGTQAQATFTDAQPQILTLSAQSPSPVYAGSAALYTVTMQFNGNQTTCSVLLSATTNSPPAWPAGANFSFVSPTISGTSTASTTMRIDVPVGAAATTYNFTVTGTPQADCQNGASAKSATGTLVVAAPVTTSLTLAPLSPTSVNYASVGPVALSATLTRTTAPAGVVAGATITFLVDGVSVGTGTTDALGVATNSYNPSALNAGSRNVTASFAGGIVGSTGYVASSTGPRVLTVNQASSTTVVTCGAGPFVYNNAPHTPCSVSVTGAGGLNLTPVPSYSNNTNAGTATASYTFLGDANHTGSNDSETFSIERAPSTTLVTCPVSVVYTGLAQTPCTASVSGIGGLSLSPTPTHTNNINVGTATASYSYGGDANHNTSSDSKTFSISVAPSVTVVTCPVSVPYNATAQTPCTVSVTGAGSLSLTPPAVHTNNTNAGTASASYTYPGDANHGTSSGSKTFLITRIDATIVVTGYDVTYDANPHTATGTATGIGGAALTGLVLTGTTHTNAGTYATDPWTFTDANGNYNNASGTVSDKIGQAAANCSIAGFSGPYDGNAHGATGSCTGVGADAAAVGSTLSLGASFTNVPGGTANWSFTGGTNYANQSGSALITITPRLLSASIIGTPTKPYDGNANATLTPANFSVGNTVGTESFTVTETAGTYNSPNVNAANTITATLTAADFTPGGGTLAANYTYPTSASGAGTIGKVDATIVVTGYDVTFNNAPHTATGTATGVGGANLTGLNLSGTTHTNAGTYDDDPWTFHEASGNYNDANGTVDDNIKRADAACTISGYSGTYDGAAHGASGSCVGVGTDATAAGSSLNLGATFTNVPGGTADWSFTGGTNYNDKSGSVLIAIGPRLLTASIINDPTKVYDGNANATLAPTNFSVGNTVGTESFTVTKTTGTYNSPNVLAANTVNTSLASTDFTAGAGTLAGNYTFPTAATGPGHITVATPTITVTAYSVTFDASPHTATGTAKGVGGVSLTGLNLSLTTHTDAGTYNNDPWSFVEPSGNYANANGTVNDFIDQAVATCSIVGYSGTYDGALHGATGSCTGVPGDASANGSSINYGATFKNVPGGTANWSFDGGTNYKDQNGSVPVAIGPKTVTASIIGDPTKVYDGNTTATLAPANFSLTGLVGTESFTVNQTAGTYNSPNVATANTVDATLAVSNFINPLNGALTGNYTLPTSASGPGHITKADATISVTGYDVTYDHNPHTATGTATGVGGANLAGLNLSGTTHTDAGTYNDSWSFTDVTGNYKNTSGTVTDKIAQAAASCTITGYSGTYDGAAHSATGSCTGVSGDAGAAGSTLTLPSITHVSETGMKAWSFEGGTNYIDQGANVQMTVIARTLTATIINDPTKVYNGNDIATLAKTNFQLANLVGTESFDVTKTTGTYNSANVATANTVSTTLLPADFTATNGAIATDYTFPTSASGPGHITKANAIILVTPYHVTFDNASHVATGTATGVLGEALAGLNLTGTTHTNAGVYASDPWTFTDATGNYKYANGTVKDEIDQAAASCTVTGYSGGYDGNAHSATGSCTGVPTDPGAAGSTLTLPSITNVAQSGPMTWNFEGGTNYVDQSSTVAMSLTARAITATIINNPTKVYDGTNVATLAATNYQLANVVATQSFTVTETAGVYASVNVGTPINVTATLTPSDFTAGPSTMASNYTFPTTAQGPGTITQALPTVAVVVTPNPVQYSDNITYSVTVSGATVPTGTVQFKLASANVGSPVTLDATGKASLGPVQQLAQGPGSPQVSAVYSGDQNFKTQTGTTTLTVTKEDAGVTYTGALFAMTGSATSSTANVTLSATVQDITALPSDPAYDNAPGDIRKATIKFVNRDAADALLCTATIGLVNAADLKTGTATCQWSPNIGASDAIHYTVGIVIDGYYTRDASTDDAIVTVAKPIGTNFITGGGYLVLSASAGPFAGGVGTKNNYGFNVKYNKNGTNLQGNMNIIIRNNGRVYQIKSTSMTSLGVNPATCPNATATSPCTAVFNSKANITDITNPSSPVGVEGNATLQVNMTDKGQPGSADSIGITVWNKSGGLWYASNWNGTKTVEQVIGGGNLVVH